VRTHVFGQGAVDRGGVGAETAFKRLFPGMLAQVPRQRPLFAAGVRTELAFERLFTRVDSHVLCQIPLRRRRVRAKRALERLLFSVFSPLDLGALLLRRRSGKVQLRNETFLLDEILAVALVFFVPAHVHVHVTFLLHLPLMRRQLLLRMVLLRGRLMLLRRLMLRRRLMMLLLYQMWLQVMMRVMHHFGGPGKMGWRWRVVTYIHLRKTKDGNLMHQKRWRIQDADGVLSDL